MHLCLLLAWALAWAAHAVDEVVVELPGGGFAGLSTTGQTAFRLRLLRHRDQLPLGSPMVGPEGPDADFKWTTYGSWSGISARFGSALISPEGMLQLRNARGVLLTESQPLKAGGSSLALSTRTTEVYGHGSSREDALHLTSNSSKPSVCNTAVYTPYYYSIDGYAALGVSNGMADWNYYAASYSIRADIRLLTWEYTGDFELYLMPAETLRQSSPAYFALIGRPRVPPVYAFGFIASRWGWEDKAYIEDTLTSFRKGKYPLDAVIMDFEWFSNETDYPYSSAGKPYYKDFGWNPALFPSPQEQLARYRQDFHVRVGLIRKPRIGNSHLLKSLQAQGYIMSGEEPSGTFPPVFKKAYAKDRCLDFSQQALRKWYSQQQGGYLDDGVEFWWNDEGDTSFFTYYWWCIAEIEGLQSKNRTKRYFSLNRGFTPGMARLGAASWTGDVDPSWEDLRAQPGMMLNWAIAGQPYVGNDIGGFNSNSTPELLSRWMQMGAFLPLMRTHSTCSPWATPHWPWLWGERASDAIRLALELRYRLVPYHYSLAHRMYTTGELWMRPLAMEFPDDPDATVVAEEWMDGAILVAPVMSKDSIRKIYIPEGSWYALRASNITQTPKHCETCFRTLYKPRGLQHRSVDLIEGPVYMGGKADYTEVPAFVRAGTVLPLAPVVQYTDALPGGPLEVQIYAGDDGTFDLIEDDGETLGYEDGSVRNTRFSWDDERRTLSWTVQGHLSVAGSRQFRELFVTMIHGRTRFSTSKTRPIGTGGFIRIREEDKPVPQVHHI
mmetsp:Transcript_107933/g.315610  ORF Transcript_107933/g.315610 Transcript_107933/m.315610 type:complete len:779 (+) Transcript_107933:88-2424(+)